MWTLIFESCSKPKTMSSEWHAYLSDITNPHKKEIEFLFKAKQVAKILSPTLIF